MVLTSTIVGLRILPFPNTHATLNIRFVLKMEVLATIPHFFKRNIREVLEIEKHLNNINRDKGLKLKSPSFKSSKLTIIKKSTQYA